MGKIILDDIFNAIKIIQKDLPKNKLRKELLKKLNFGDKFLLPIKIKQNIPPYNQSSMDGIGVIKKKKKYKIKGTTKLNIYKKFNLTEDECLVVKTGSLIPDDIKYIIPIERLFKYKKEFHVLEYNFEKNFIRKKGHIFKKGQLINSKNKELSLKDFISLKSINNIQVKVFPKISFKIISTGSEFDRNHFIYPTNAEYIDHFIRQNNHIVKNCIHLKDDQNKIMKEIKKYDCDITIVIGGTGKSKDDINFDKFNLKINGLDLKPGRPFKYLYEKSKIVLFFPGNPTSSFVLTNILLKSIFNYYKGQTYLTHKKINIKDIDYDFSKLKRKSFLFADIVNKNIKIFSNQESSNFSNIINSNYLIYYDKTSNLRMFYIDD